MSEYAAATATVDISPGRARGEIREGWDINGNANGGYLLGIALDAMCRTAGRPAPASVTAHFLAPGSPGPVEIHSTIVKEGRRFTTLTAHMGRDGRPILQLLGAFGEPPGLDIASSRFAGPPDLPPIESCVLRGPDTGGVAVGLMNRLRQFLDPESAGFLRGEFPGTAEMRGWIEFADGTPWDAMSVALACDSFPPALFNLGVPPGWMPTVELTVHVRAAPAAGPLRGRFSTRFIQGGVFEEDGELWDSTGTLVALSRQYALVTRS